MNDLYISHGLLKTKEKEYEALLTEKYLYVKFEETLNPKDLLGRPLTFVSDRKPPQKFSLVLDFQNIGGDYFPFHILLLHELIDESSKKTYFQIESKGLFRALNNLSDLSRVGLAKSTEKEKHQCEIKIESKIYKCSFVNLLLAKNINFTTAIRLEPKDGLDESQIKDVYRFAKSLIEFLTLNTYSKIDNFEIYNEYKTCTEVLINQETNTEANNHFLFIGKIKNLKQLLECFPSKIGQQSSLFYYDENFHDFDIVRMLGKFEGLFNDFVEKSKEYIKQKKAFSESVHLDELKEILKGFKEKHGLNKNRDFDSILDSVGKYGSSLSSKLEYTFDNLSKVLNLSPSPQKFFCSSSMNAMKTLRDFRNAICHGHTNTKRTSDLLLDSMILQMMIYFLILKYIAELSDSTIKKCFDNSSFRLLLCPNFEENKISQK